MGVAASITFTAPTGGCRVNAAAAFEASISGSGYSDFGSSDGYQIQMDEYLSDGTTFVNAEASTRKPATTARSKYTDLYTSTYSVPAGHVVVVSLRLITATSHTMTAWNIDLRVEQIKR